MAPIHCHEKTDDFLLLQKLQESNAEKWQKIGELAHKLDELKVTETSNDTIVAGDSSLQSLVQQLTTEIHLQSCGIEDDGNTEFLRYCRDLREEIHRQQQLSKDFSSMSSAGGVSTTTMDSGTCHDSSDSTMFESQLIDSFYSLRALREYLESLQSRKSSFLSISETIQSEQEIILEQVKRQEMRFREDGVQCMSNETVHSHSPNVFGPQLSSEQLHEDLKYVCSLVPAGSDSDSESNNTPLLEIMDQLIDRLLHDKDDPYISISAIDPQHLQLLKDCHIIQSMPHDQTLIRLLENYNLD